MKVTMRFCLLKIPEGQIPSQANAVVLKYGVKKYCSCVDVCPDSHTVKTSDNG